MKIHFPCMINEYAKNIENIHTVCLAGQYQLIIKCVGQIRDYPTYSKVGGLADGCLFALLMLIF